MEYSYLLDLADECEDPYMRLMYASKYSFMCVLLLSVCVCACVSVSVCVCVIWDLCLLVAATWFISVYYALQRTWKPFNPILGETYEMVNHGGITFISEQVSFKVSICLFIYCRDIYKKFVMMLLMEVEAIHFQTLFTSFLD